MVAAIGQMVFSLSLGGTFMVVYGSYLGEREIVAGTAMWTADRRHRHVRCSPDLRSFPRCSRCRWRPPRAPGLIFSTLPQVFAAIPLGWLFGLLFFAGLFGAGYLSDVAAFEVLVAGLTDNTRLTRTRAVWLMSAAVFVIAIPPTINNAIFVPWDLTFGSGMQTLGALARGAHRRLVHAPRRRR